MTDHTSADAQQQAANEEIRREAARQLMAEQLQAVQEADVRNPVLPNMRVNPVGAAQIVLERFFTKDALVQLAYYRENWYSYYEKLWSIRTEEDVDHFLHNRLLLCRMETNDGDLIDFNTSRANVSEIRFQIQQIVSIPSHYRAPCVLREGKWREVNARGKMVCRGQIVNMLTGSVESNHHMFIPNGALWEYAGKAKPPAGWLKFLKELFGDADDEVQLLQEWFGYVLSGDTWAQKGLIIQGPKRAGKGVIGHVLAMLLGKSMVSSPALHAIGATFGLESLVDKRMCLISDARLSNRIDTMAVIEVLLRVIAGDPVDVNRKHKGSLQMELDARVMMLSNSMPQLGDESDAINSRFMILQLSESFFGKEDYGLLERLVEEMPAIANWAIEGYRRLSQRGRFVEPESSIVARKEWYDENNPMAQFIDDQCTLGANEKMRVDDLYMAYRDWCDARGIPCMAANALSRRIAAMLGCSIRRYKSNSVRMIAGISVRLGNF